MPKSAVTSAYWNRQYTTQNRVPQGVGVRFPHGTIKSSPRKPRSLRHCPDGGDLTFATHSSREFAKRMSIRSIWRWRFDGGRICAPQSAESPARWVRQALRIKTSLRRCYWVPTAFAPVSGTQVVVLESYFEPGAILSASLVVFMLKWTLLSLIVCLMAPKSTATSF